MLAVFIGSVLFGSIEKLVYGNIQQCDKLIERVKAGMLAPIFDIHDGARDTVYKLGEELLRPAFGLPFPFDLPSQGVEVQSPVVLIHSHFTPILFYISGVNMGTKQNFMLR